MERFNVITKIKVRFSDIDALGHVNAPRYFTYLEEGRLDLFGKITGKSSLKDIDFIVARLEGDFMRPVYLSDDVVLKTAITEIGNTSVTLYQELFANGQLCFKSKSVVVFYDFKNQTKKKVPEIVIKNIQNYILKEE